MEFLLQPGQTPLQLFQLFPLPIHETLGIITRVRTEEIRMAQEKLREVLAEFSMSPFDKGPSLSPYVARSLDIVDRSGIDYLLTPMGTVLEGGWKEVMEVVTACFERMGQDCDRISCTLKIDYRKGRQGRLSSKVRSVEEKVGRPLKRSGDPDLSG